jgi:uncharacterized membrane protein YidH (DUF202 family)
MTVSEQSVDQSPGTDKDLRIEQFRAEIEDMKLKGGSGEGEKRLLVIGILLVAVGVGLAVFAAVQVGSSGSAGSTADNQRAYLAQGSFLGLALIVAGAALFVRYSLARYLRFWLIRATYESRANADRIVDAIERAAGIEPGGTHATTAPAPATVMPPAGAPQAPPSPAPPAPPSV